MDKLRVLIASRSQTALDKLRGCLAGCPDFECSTRLISNGHTDPLHGLDQPPDVLVLRFDPHQMAELAMLADTSSAARPPLIVVGPPVNAEAMRLAIRSGAKDFLVEPLQPQEVIAALQRIHGELRRNSSRAASQIDVVIGAAGGVGASFLACNIAHLTAVAAKRSCLLLDLDLNYAPIAHFLDLQPERGLIEAIEVLETLDEHAIPGYVSRHRSGLHVMSTVQKTVVLSRDLPAERLAALLNVLSTRYQHVLVDSPHYIDTHNAAVLGMARSVLLVLQQSVMHVKNAARLMHILNHELAVPRERIRIVVNRFNKRSTVQLEDIQRALDVPSLLTVPNHYRLSLDSIDTATPLFDIDKDAAVARSLLDLQAEIGGRERTARSGLLSRLPLFARR
jgi:pilus assembly protein CpaE